MSALPQIHPNLDPSEGRRERQIREAQKMEAIGRLASGVAHDFNNLLTGIVLCSDLLLAKLEKGNHLRHYAEEIRTAASQGTDLTRQLLSVTRPGNAGHELLSLNDVINGIRTLLRRLIGENVALVTDLALSLGLLKMDLAQLQQVILNLVLNARDAMPGGGQVTLRTSHAAHSGEIELEVRDTGCGMDAQTVAHVFEPFYTTKTMGNGLGLATVSRIVKRAGGRIVVESEPGKGTRVIVRLPQVVAATRPSAAPRNSEAGGASSRKQIRGNQEGNREA